MILYIENPKDAIRKLLELINEFGEVAGYKIDAQKSLAFLYTSKQMRPNETSKLLHSKGNHKQDEKIALRMGENICKQIIGQRINLQNI